MPICWFCCWEGVKSRGELSRPCQHFPIFTKLTPDDGDDIYNDVDDIYNDVDDIYNDGDDDYNDVDDVYNDGDDYYNDVDDILSLEDGRHQFAFLPLIRLSWKAQRPWPRPEPSTWACHPTSSAFHQQEKNILCLKTKLWHPLQDIWEEKLVRCV